MRRSRSVPELASYAGLRHAVLSRPELEALLVEMVRARDADPPTATTRRQYERLRNRVVAMHLRFAVKVASRFRGRGLPLTDLVQHAALGLMRAADTFDPVREIQFITYAAHWARHFCERAVADLGRTIRVPVHTLETTKRLDWVRDRHRAATGDEPSVAEIARATGETPAVVRRSLEVSSRSMCSLDAPLTVDDGPTTWIDMLADTTSESPEDALLRRERETEARRAAATLEGRNGRMLAARFGLGDPDGESRTLEEIGPPVGITRERARQVLAAQIKELRGVVADV